MELYDFMMHIIALCYLVLIVGVTIIFLMMCFTDYEFKIETKKIILIQENEE
jgi:hypothetical protein